MFSWHAVRFVRVQNIEKLLRNPLACGCYEKKFMSAKPPQTIVKQIDPTTGEVKKKKTIEIPQITLLQGDSLTVTSLIEAEKLAKRRDLKLVKIVDLDTKSQRPVYKLMTGAELHREDLKQRELRKQKRANTTIKGEKVLMLNSRITEHDLETSINKAAKWIQKSYEVKVVVSNVGENADLGERIYKKMETSLKEAIPEVRLIQKRVKGSDLKFQIIPPVKNNNTDNNKNRSDSDAL